jgi:hypothetical protein
MIRTIQKRMQKMPELGIEDMLEYLGLERHRGLVSSALPAVAALAVGIVAGAGVALLFAPRPGKELRADIERKLIDMRDRRMPELVEHAFEQVRNAGAEMQHADAPARSNHSNPV